MRRSSCWFFTHECVRSVIPCHVVIVCQGGMERGDAMGMRTRRSRGGAEEEEQWRHWLMGPHAHKRAGRSVSNSSSSRNSSSRKATALEAGTRASSDRGTQASMGSHAAVQTPRRVCQERGQGQGQRPQQQQQQARRWLWWLWWMMAAAAAAPSAGGAGLQTAAGPCGWQMTDVWSPVSLGPMRCRRKERHCHRRQWKRHHHHHHQQQ